MKFRSLPLALAALAPYADASAQASPQFDIRTAPVAAGSWSYRATASGSEAAFMDAGTVRRLVVRCTRMTRTVSLSMTSTVTAPMVTVLTTDTGRLLPVRFDRQAFQLIADVPAGDPLLDALAFSRGRVALSISGLPPLVVPAWAEPARVVEDCRS